MEANAGVTILGRMSGVRSIHRNLKHEDEAARRHIEAQEQELFGVAPSEQSPEPDDMDIMAARDVHLHYNSPPPSGSQAPAAPTPTPSPSPAPTPAAAAPASGLSTLAKAGIAAAALSGPLGLGVGIGTMLTQPSAPAPVVQQADPTLYGLDLLPPDQPAESEPRPVN